MRTTLQVNPRPWTFIGLLVPLVVGALGCPHFFGKGGSADRAVHKAEECLERCLQ